MRQLGRLRLRGGGNLFLLGFRDVVDGADVAAVPRIPWLGLLPCALRLMVQR